MFSKSKIKRFNEIVSCAPPVGSYDVGKSDNKSRAALFDRSKRFSELKKEDSLSTSSIFSDSSVDSNGDSVKRKRDKELEQLKKNYNKCKEKLVETVKLLEELKKSKESHIRPQLNDRDEMDTIAALKLIVTKCKEMENVMVTSEEHMNGRLGQLTNKLTAANESHSRCLHTIKCLDMQHTTDKLKFDETVQKFQEQLESVSCKADELEHENEFLRESLASRDERIKQLSEEINQNETDASIALKNIILNCKQMEESIVSSEDDMNAKLQSLTDRLITSNDTHTKCLEEISTLKRNHYTQQLQSKETLDSTQLKLESTTNRLRHIQQENELLKQNLESREAKIDELNEDIERKEVEMTENLKSITMKFQAMENSAAEFKIKSAETEDILRKQLNATKHSFRLCKQDLISLRSTYEVQQKSAIITINQLEERERDNRIMKERCMSLDEELSKLEEEKSNEHLYTQIEIWKNKYEELAVKIGPFQECLDKYALEHQTLLADNTGKEEEIASLAQRYAEILGHQNTKQKIKHLIKLKENMMEMKKELSQLQSQSVKDKATIRKLKNQNRPKQFNKNDAFKHPLSNIENCQGS